MMSALSRFLIPAIVVAVLSGCVSYSLVESSNKRSIDGIYNVSTAISWSKMEDGNLEVWTREGPLLQQLIFFKGVEDGDYLIKLPGQSEDTLPKFRKEMTFLEIQDFMIASFKRINAQDIEIQQMTPAKFGEKDGFRIDYKFKTEDGIGKTGFLVGTIVEEELHAITYFGTDIHYFDLNKADAEKIIQSISFEK